MTVSDDFLMTKRMNYRSLFLHIIFRPLKYIISIYLLIIVLVFFLHNNGTIFKKSTNNSSVIFFNIFDALIISPVIETLFLYFLFSIFKNINFKYINNNFLYAIFVTSTAWFTHGMNIFAVFPAIMFFVSSIYIIRTIDVLKINKTYTIIGALVIHVIYNIPYVLRLTT